LNKLPHELVNINDFSAKITTPPNNPHHSSDNPHHHKANPPPHPTQPVHHLAMPTHRSAIVVFPQAHLSKGQAMPGGALAEVHE